MLLKAVLLRPVKNIGFYNTANYSTRNKFAKVTIITATAGCGCIALYHSVSDKEKRQISVTLGGFRRFLRFVFHYNYLL